MKNMPLGWVPDIVSYDFYKCCISWLNTPVYIIKKALCSTSSWLCQLPICSTWCQLQCAVRKINKNIMLSCFIDNDFYSKSSHFVSLLLLLLLLLSSLLLLLLLLLLLYFLPFYILVLSLLGIQWEQWEVSTWERVSTNVINLK